MSIGLAQIRRNYKATEGRSSIPALNNIEALCGMISSNSKDVRWRAKGTNEQRNSTVAKLDTIKALLEEALRLTLEDPNQ